MRKNISSIEVTFPFSSWNDSNSLKIYQYTIEELLKKESRILIHIDKDNQGTLYNSRIDELLCSLYGLDYPSIKINGLKLVEDTSIDINIEKSSILLKDTDDKNYDIYKYIEGPPKNISSLIVIIENNIEFLYL